MSDPVTMEIPLFPLDGVVLFPGTVHQFHIFEERYKLLISDALERRREIGIPLFKPGWEQHYFESPAIHRTCGVGRITEYELLPEGRYNITVEGIARGRILREIIQTPYRRAEVEVIEDANPPETRRETAREINVLQHLSSRLTELLPQFQRDVAALSFGVVSAGATVDQIAHRFVRDIYDRQSILDEADVLRRLQLTRVQLLLLLQRFLNEQEYESLSRNIAKLD